MSFSILGVNCMSPVQATPFDVESLVVELQAHPVTTNEFFRTFRARQLQPRQLRAFVRQYHYFCFHFVKVLEGLLYHTPIHETEMRTELAKTLYSELGSGSPAHVHIRQLERFAYAIGLQPQDVQHTIPIPAVTTYLDTLRRLFFHSGHVTALGAALAVETTAASEFKYFVPGLEQYEQFHPGELEFFTLHLAEEQHHRNLLVEAVRKTARSEDDLHRVAEGAREAADAWLEFWAGMYRMVFDANPADSRY